MSFFDAISTGFRKFADFQGRAGRPEFWWFMLFLLLLGLAASIIDHAIGFGAWMMGPASGIETLVTFIPALSVGTRRLHDIGRSGWWQLIVLVPLAGLILIIYWWCQPGIAQSATGQSGVKA